MAYTPSVKAQIRSVEKVLLIESQVSDWPNNRGSPIDAYLGIAHAYGRSSLPLVQVSPLPSELLWTPKPQREMGAFGAVATKLRNHVRFGLHSLGH